VIEDCVVHATITSKRQVTFPAAVLEAIGVGPGDRIEIVPSAEGYLLRAKRVDHGKLAPLRNSLKPDIPPFDLVTFRQLPHETSLRD
jgi:bifunctional DNA-binding transcriptional regulator/antitoxin component of YhaV-PrlF toxin-antitoxin module